MIVESRAIRDRLRDDAALAAWFAEKFPGKDVKHFLGYKENRSAKDFPYLAAAPTVELIERWPGHGKPEIAIVCGIIAPDVDEGESQALALMSEVTGLVLNALLVQPLCPAPRLIWTGQARRVLDFDVRHPTYEGVVTLLNLDRD